jgi:hypothetical protein
MASNAAGSDPKLRHILATPQSSMLRSCFAVYSRIGTAEAELLRALSRTRA